ncbi:AraC family transcriptional regulator [Lentzea flava]|uniref:AraC family transcriptional regulator n=1 Tax=Lentzea flava TaxID=103732 RepID=A0ABQ2UQB4_9PSEU|nr:AraC family transcriptional regulator [Lentzea flava]MCP2201084.1 AraC-type DNA-binding protein [Lentzea flava]GGU47962.1 AraC family transcriptional regulator [Lentzea flava]
MDVFTDVIATMRVGRAKFTRSRWSGPWGHRFGPYPGAGFHVVLRGSCWLIPPAGAPVRLDAGDVVFLPHGALHGLSDRPDRTAAELPPARETDHTGDDPDADTHLVCGAYRLDRGQAHPFLRTLPEVLHLRARPGRHPALRAAVDLLGADVAESRPGAGAALPALLDLLLVYLLRAWLEEESERSPGTGWCAAFSDPVVATALRHVHREPAHPWTVSELAGRVGMSKTAFARRFTALVGQSPMAYLTWWRLSTGARLLRDGDETLAAVARQVGYTSEFAFATAFKREFGVPPGRFRRRSAHLDDDGARGLVVQAPTV